MRWERVAFQNFNLRISQIMFLQMKRIVLFSLALASFSQGEFVEVDPQFIRWPSKSVREWKEKPPLQAESFATLHSFIRENADFETLTRWFGKPELNHQEVGTRPTPPLPKDYVTTYLLQGRPIMHSSIGGPSIYQSYFFSIEETELGILFIRRGPATDEGNIDPSRFIDFGSYFLAKWPREKLGSYQDYATEKLNQWEDEQFKAILEILKKKLAEDLKAEPKSPPVSTKAKNQESGSETERPNKKALSVD